MVKRVAPEKMVFGNRVTCYPPPLLPNGAWAKGLYRITYYDAAGVRHNSSANTHDAAVIKCRKLAAASGSSSSLRSLQPFGALLDDYEAAILPGLSTRYREAQATTLRKLRAEAALVQTQCVDVTRGRMQPVFNTAAKTRTYGGMTQLKRSITHILNFGRGEGYIGEGQNPLRDINLGDKPVTEHGEDADGPLRDDEVPTHEAIADLGCRFAAATGIWWHELMVLLAAYSGVRAGELCALTKGRCVVAGHKDFAKHPNTLRVFWQVLEAAKTETHAHGRGRRWLTPPKGSKRRYAWFLPETPSGLDLLGMLNRRLAELDGDEALVFPMPGTDGEGHYCITTNERRTGEWMDRSGYLTKQFRPLIDDLPGWPDACRWHELRDAYCTTLSTDLRMPAAECIIFTGHEDTATFTARYEGTRPEGAEQRATAALERWKADRLSGGE